MKRYFFIEEFRNNYGVWVFGIPRQKFSIRYHGGARESKGNLRSYFIELPNHYGVLRVRPTGHIDIFSLIDDGDGHLYYPGLPNINCHGMFCTGRYTEYYFPVTEDTYAKRYFRNMEETNFNQDLQTTVTHKSLKLWEERGFSDTQKKQCRGNFRYANGIESAVAYMVASSEFLLKYTKGKKHNTMYMDLLEKLKKRNSVKNNLFTLEKAKEAGGVEEFYF